MAWTIFYQLTQALDCIHQDSHGTLLHRNINPRCVLFKEEERKNIKLGGFGMAKKLDFEDNFSTTYIPNTCYLSPEQI
jgi:serine/threonine protein kinase